MTLAAAYQILRVLLSLVLYGFLCLVIWIIWQDVKSTRALISLSQSGKSILIDINTTHHHDVTPITSLGRAPTNIIVIALWWLEDLGSRNGTYLNNHLVTTPTIISSGDTIAIGSYTFTFKG